MNPTLTPAPLYWWAEVSRVPAWVVILLFLAALVCGYMGMDGLDRFLEHREESLPPVPKAQTLVFGQGGNVIPVRE